MVKWKYQIIEYAYKSIVYEGGERKVEYCKSLHKTNSWLVCELICLFLKLSGIKYEKLVK